MTAAHGGYGSEKTPLGGGAAIFERLCQAWLHDYPELELYTAGSGPNQPEGLPYKMLARPEAEPSKLGLLAYARFCRKFESACTAYALNTKPDIVLSHDISEGPNIALLKRAGIPVVTISHVDVVDIFNKLYLGGLLPTRWLTSFYRLSRASYWPQILKLVFEKQEQVMGLGLLNVVPSEGAALLLKECYSKASSPIAIVGWGAPRLRYSKSELSQEAASLRSTYGIATHHKIILSLSRLSPEKAQHRLLEAVLKAEEDGTIPRDISIVIAGSKAFMRGKQHEAKLRNLAQKLKTPVYFPGHVGGIERSAWYHSASVFVVCSLHESYGLTTLEAMQQGCPVVAVSSCGTRETIDPGCGVLVEPGFGLSRRLWAAIEGVLSSKELHHKLAQGARIKASDCTLEKAASALMHHMKKVWQK